MRKTALSITLAAAFLSPSDASAQASASVELRLALPVIVPQLVVVSPGVQVIPDVDEEVFFVDGFYWVRHDRGWYRSRSHRAGWVLVGPRGVPARLVQLPPGKYRRWKPAKVAPAPVVYRERGQGRHEGHDGHEGKKHKKHGKHGKHDD
jgi:hypothetical protein